MKKQNLIIIMIIVAIIIISIIIANITGKNNQKTQANDLKKEEFTVENTNGDKANTSDALKKERTELEYYISNITLEKKATQTIFKMNITNKTGKEIQGKMVDIVLIGKNGQEEARMAIYIRNIKSGETITTQSTIDNDFTNVYDFKLVER